MGGEEDVEVPLTVWDAILVECGIAPADDGRVRKEGFANRGCGWEKVGRGATEGSRRP